MELYTGHKHLRSPSDSITTAARVNEIFNGGAKIHVGRPSGAPVAIFNPTLATLQKSLDNLDSVPITESDVENAAEYLRNAASFYATEELREASIKKMLETALGAEAEWKQTITIDDRKEIKPDGIWWHKMFLAVVLELKNISGLSGNPTVQALVDYATVISQNKVRCR